MAKPGAVKLGLGWQRGIAIIEKPLPNSGLMPTISRFIKALYAGNATLRLYAKDYNLRGLTR